MCPIKRRKPITKYIPVYDAAVHYFYSRYAGRYRTCGDASPRSKYYVLNRKSISTFGRIATIQYGLKKTPYRSKLFIFIRTIPVCLLQCTVSIYKYRRHFIAFNVVSYIYNIIRCSAHIRRSQCLSIDLFLFFSF